MVIEAFLERRHELHCAFNPGRPAINRTDVEPQLKVLGGNSHGEPQPRQATAEASHSRGKPQPVPTLSNLSPSRPQNLKYFASCRCLLMQCKKAFFDLDQVRYGSLYLQNILFDILSYGRINDITTNSGHSRLGCAQR